MEKMMTNHKSIWVFIEQTDGQIADVSLELLAKAGELAQSLGGQVCGLLLGHQIEMLAEKAIHYGADLIFLADHPELATYRTLPYSRVLVDLIQTHHPESLLIGATPLGRDLAPRVASAAKVGLTADCTDLQIGDYESRKEKVVYKDLLYQIRPAFGGNIIATIVNPKTKPQMATVREGVMQAHKPDTTRTGEIVAVTPAFKPADFALKVLSREVRQPSVRLKDASVIVAGGGGVSDPQDFQLIQELAHVLGGEVGASRAAVDAGFVTSEHQIGQTGVTVRPRLYIAAGISGAIQHRSGMDESNKIIAINTDPDAPIFQVAHYKIVGDLEEVLPLLIQALREKAR
jgi:electron transfer flavoprotein alpha subunit